MPKPRKTLKGKINKLVDNYLHPSFKDHPTLILLDGLLHAIVEQNPPESLQKFVKYNVTKLLKHHTSKQKNVEYFLLAKDLWRR